MPWKVGFSLQMTVLHRSSNSDLFSDTLSTSHYTTCN